MTYKFQTLITALLPPSSTVRLTEATVAPEYVLLQLTATAPTTCCPRCAMPSSCTAAIGANWQPAPGARLPSQSNSPCGSSCVGIRAVHAASLPSDCQHSSRHTPAKPLGSSWSCSRSASRSAAMVAAWLARHPTITVVGRDRSPLYADGIRRGAPDAVQVVDRFHPPVLASHCGRRHSQAPGGRIAILPEAPMKGEQAR